MLCQELSIEGFGRSSSSAPDSTLSLSGIPMAHDRSVSMRWTTPRRRLSAELARVFHLARGCAISDAGRYRPHPGLHIVNPKLGGGVRLPGTSRGIHRRAKAKRKGADRTA